MRNALLTILAAALLVLLIVVLTLSLDAYQRAHPCPKGEHWSTQHKITACRR